MKLSQIEKLYSKLSPIEAANLVLEAAANGNQQEADAIDASIQCKTYQVQDLDYKDHLCRLQYLIGIYGMTYWRNMAYFNLCNMLDNDLGAEPATSFLINLAAIEQAMVNVCTQLKIDPEIIKKMALCNDNWLEGMMPQADEEKVQQYVNLFAPEEKKS